MGRREKSVLKHVDPEYISQELPEEEPVKKLEPAPAITKADACRAALAAGIIRQASRPCCWH